MKTHFSARTNSIESFFRYEYQERVDAAGARHSLTLDDAVLDDENAKAADKPTTDICTIDFFIISILPQAKPPVAKSTQESRKSLGKDCAKTDMALRFVTGFPESVIPQPSGLHTIEPPEVPTSVTFNLVKRLTHEGTAEIVNWLVGSDALLLLELERLLIVCDERAVLR